MSAKQQNLLRILFAWCFLSIIAYLQEMSKWYNSNAKVNFTAEQTRSRGCRLNLSQPRSQGSRLLVPQGKRVDPGNEFDLKQKTKEKEEIVVMAIAIIITLICLVRVTVASLRRRIQFTLSGIDQSQLEVNISLSFLIEATTFRTEKYRK